MSAEPRAEVRLNIGAGATYLAGFHNIDISFRADISMDVGREPLPFDDHSVDVVFSYHTLEHVEDYLFALGEIHRVLKPGGRLLIGVPYVTLTEYNLVNPFHRHNFNEHSFKFFHPGSLKGSAVEENPIQLREVFHRYHYIGGFKLVPPPLRGWCRRHLFNVVRKIDFGLIKVDAERPVLVGGALARAMRREFASYLDQRLPYDPPTSGNANWVHAKLAKAWQWWNGHR